MKPSLKAPEQADSITNGAFASGRRSLKWATDVNNGTAHHSVPAVGTCCGRATVPTLGVGTAALGKPAVAAAGECRSNLGLLERSLSLRTPGSESEINSTMSSGGENPDTSLQPMVATMYENRAWPTTRRPGHSRPQWLRISAYREVSVDRNTAQKHRLDSRTLGPAREGGKNAVIQSKSIKNQTIDKNSKTLARPNGFVYQRLYRLPPKVPYRPWRATPAPPGG